MIASNRPLTKRQQDIVDFMQVVKHSTDAGQRAIDTQRLQYLGEKVWPSGGGQEILLLVEKAKADKAIHFDELGQLKS